ncbi:solanesyl-diphosphate synthase 1, mitochondrial isoform X2 [Rosa chinensis]|uniref:solanesyl-diphosphate synthase 1, mitochondrial isoform X2 n=1 Tax=Rosa chinensis TaxID=74649 RepID=UPI001AD90BC1|nr:solanesyl-diphosphate synthase 1, mitochondrial isoform X2 [Rosa chinensis]
MKFDIHCSKAYYMEKTYYRNASSISNSCKALAILAGHTTQVAEMAFDYGKNLGLAFQLIDDVLDFSGTSSTSLGKGSLSDIRHGIITAPILFALEEFPQLGAVVEKGFDNPANMEIRTRDLARKHANLAAKAIKSLPESEDESIRRSRMALRDLTNIVLTRTK